MKNKIIGLGILTITAVQIRNIYLIRRNHESIRVLFDSDHKIRNSMTNKLFEIDHIENRFNELKTKIRKTEKGQLICVKNSDKAINYVNDIIDKMNGLYGQYDINGLIKSVTNLQDRLIKIEKGENKAKAKTYSKK